MKIDIHILIREVKKLIKPEDNNVLYKIYFFLIV